MYIIMYIIIYIIIIMSMLITNIIVIIIVIYSNSALTANDLHDDIVQALVVRLCHHHHHGHLEPHHHCHRDGDGDGDERMHVLQRMSTSRHCTASST